LIFIESVPYLTYIVTATHISTTAFQLLLLIAWLPLIFHPGLANIKLLVITLLICIIGESAAKTTLNISRELRNIIANPFLTYDQKMTRTYKGFYSAMKEVTRLTPEDSIIAIPPRANPWEFEGNVAMVAYFLYPRKVINLTVDSKQNLKIDRKLYALIARGASPRNTSVDYGWPKVQVKAKNIWKIDTDSSINTQIQKDYNPDTDQWDWGLIEVKNE